jgi:two-component system chemotaxis sensor kinase CheA
VDPADLEDLKQIFVAEAKDQIDELEGALVELETRPDDRELLQHIFRIAHSFKGSAMALSLSALADLGHAMEDVLEDLERRHAPATSAVCSLLLEGADAAREMLPDVLAGHDQLRQGAADVIRRMRRGGTGQEELTEPALSSRPDAAPRDEDGASDSLQKTVRIDVAKLDQMADLIGEISVSRDRIEQQIRALGGPAVTALLEDLEQNDRLYAELAGVVQTARMVPVGPWLQQYARAVRDVARAHGKEARLVTLGGDVEVDLAMIERLRDPLTHLLRNAIDHGIERPEARLSLGKDPIGTVTLAASYEGGGIALRISDDGAGLSARRIAERARALGNAAAVDALSAEQLHRLVFEPGFSTAPFVSDLSGRGLGLTVVRERIKALRGSIRIESAEGKGTSFTIRLPLTLATIDGLSVGAGGERYVIPLDAVVECLDLPEGALVSERRSMLNLRGRTLPCARLRDLMGIRGAAPPRQGVVVVGHDGGLGGLVVDTFDGEGRTVIKPLGRLLRGIPGVAGSTILVDGKVALILDVAALLGDLAPRLCGALEPSG